MISQVIPGLIVGFREGMEAFLIVGIMLRYLDKIERGDLKKNVTNGLWAGNRWFVIIWSSSLGHHDASRSGRWSRFPKYGNPVHLSWH